MKINFKKPGKNVLEVKISPRNKDETVQEKKGKVLYLKCDEKMNLRKLFLLVRKMIALAKNAKAERITFAFSDLDRKSVV